MWFKVGFVMMTTLQLIIIPPSRMAKIDWKLDENDDNVDGSSKPTVEKLSETVESMKKVMGALSRQTLLQQLFIEERIRSDGNSGVKQRRINVFGTRNYHAASHSGRSVNAIHDHANNIRTVGMGEVIAVLNGVEFRTRHNDFRLNMPHKTSKDWHATEEIPFPDVPPEVLNKEDVGEQIKEMRAWFKAWKDQDYKIRDYRKYFKPVLCYLEGAWTTSTEGKIDEPFESDRHFVDASSWFDLQEKIRFTSYTGRKDNLENFSFLPTTMMNVSEDGYPKFAQWNYRIMCHPLRDDLPLNRLRVVDELGPLLTFKRTRPRHMMERSARFQINPVDSDTWTERRNSARWGLLDKLMSEIPGKDNYVGKLEDNAFGLTALSVDPKNEGSILTASNYHRVFKVGDKGAMGLSTRHRGYSDENLFMAMNTQPNVAGMDLTSCKKEKKGREKVDVCETIHQKWSYAFPLEIIFLTPLSKWNPYDIEYKGDYKSSLGQTVEEGGRNGDVDDSKLAYDGTNSKRFYQTPVEFFSGEEVGSGKADTTKNTAGVLDKKGKLRKCKASGTRIFFPDIADVGTLRQRFPIVPVHGEGSAAWKELEATKDVLLDSKTNSYAFREPLQSTGTTTPQVQAGEDVTFNLQLAKATPPGPHTHSFQLTPNQIDKLRKGKKAKAITEERAGHNHEVWIAFQDGKYEISKCDGDRVKDDGEACWDHHPKDVEKEDELDQ